MWTMFRYDNRGGKPLWLPSGICSQEMNVLEILEIFTSQLKDFLSLINLGVIILFSQFGYTQIQTSVAKVKPRGVLCRVSCVPMSTAFGDDIIELGPSPQMGGTSNSSLK